MLRILDHEAAYSLVDALLAVASARFHFILKVHHDRPVASNDDHDATLRLNQPHPFKKTTKMTTSVNTPHSLLYQISQFFFLLSALFSDLALVRFCLVAAYVFLLLQNALGWPMWDAFIGKDPSQVQVDAIVWTVVNVSLHGWALAKLLLDERLVSKFATPDDEAIWAFFHAKTGVSRFDFIPILESGTWVHFEPGAAVNTEDAVYIVVRGLIRCHIVRLHRGDASIGLLDAADPDASFESAVSAARARHEAQLARLRASNASSRHSTEVERVEIHVTTTINSNGNGNDGNGNGNGNTQRNLDVVLGSGAVFDVQLLNLLGVDLGFWNDGFFATALTDATCFAVPVQALEKVCKEGPPVVQQVWKDFVQHIVADIANRPWSSDTLAASSSMSPARFEALQERDPQALERIARWMHPHFTPPPERRPSCKERLSSFVSWIWNSISLLPPRGLRHHPVPKVGIQAARRAVERRATRSNLNAAANGNGAASASSSSNSFFGVTGSMAGLSRQPPATASALSLA